MVIMHLVQDPEIAQLFTDRPVVSRTCEHCGGCGTTRAPYALAPGGPILGAPQNAICAVVIGSCHIFEASREASEIAKRSGRPVAFHFIDQTVVVQPGDDPELWGRAWWIERHGETPEQSWEKR